MLQIIQQDLAEPTLYTQTSPEPLGFVLWCIWWVFMLFFIAVTVFWIWIIFDIIKREFKNPNDKTLWILIVLLGGWLGAVIYYFVVKRPNKN